MGVVSWHAQVWYVCGQTLCLLTAHDTAGSGKISVAKVEEYREVSRLIPRSQAKRCIVKLIAAM